MRGLFLAMLALALWPGCGTSRWAMDDPQYRAKYSRPYEEGEKIPRMAKQAIDARHIKDQAGGYVGVAAAADPISVGGEIGLFGYSEPWVEGRVALAGLLGSGAEGEFGGFSAGLRLQTPSRLAPFAGVGVFSGADGEDREDGVDNDSNGRIDEEGEDTHYQWIAAAYPEIGVHYWITSSFRVTGSASYYFTTEGRNSDFVFLGASLGWLSY